MGRLKRFFLALACALLFCLPAACAAPAGGPAENSELGGLTRINFIKAGAAGPPAAFSRPPASEEAHFSMNLPPSQPAAGFFA